MVGDYVPLYKRLSEVEDKKKKILDNAHKSRLLEMNEEDLRPSFKPISFTSKFPLFS
jgi:hypothetical protein